MTTTRPSPAFEGQEAFSFLATLFGDVHERYAYNIWTLPDRHSHWYRASQTANAAEYIRTQLVENELNIRYDVYASVGLHGPARMEYPPTSRGAANQVMGIVGLWIDIDLANSAHKKENLPKSIDEAYGLLMVTGLTPTFIIFSGHGLQAWWRFKEPWYFDESGSLEETARERKKAVDLAARWVGTFKQHAQHAGWYVDSTQDLSRVLRVPGTFNQKGEQPEAVYIYEYNDVAYDPEELDECTLDPEIIQALENTDTSTVELVFDPTADPPWQKFEALRQLEPKFQDSWDHKRTKKDLPDQSASSYDFALINYAIQANWTDQELCNLMVAHRRKYGEDLKRPDYYRITIANARKTSKHERVAEDAATLVAAAVEVNATGNDEEKAKVREEILDALSALLHIRINRFVRYVGRENSFRLYTEKGDVLYEGPEKVQSLASFTSGLWSATGHQLPKLSGSKWSMICQMLAQIWEDESLGSDATEIGQTKEWISAYLGEKTKIQENPSTANDVKDVIRHNHPFTINGDTYISATGLRQFLTLNRGERISVTQLGTALRAYGAEAVNKHFRLNGKDTTKAVWKLPR